MRPIVLYCRAVKAVITPFDKTKIKKSIIVCQPVDRFLPGAARRNDGIFDLTNPTANATIIQRKDATG